MPIKCLFTWLNTYKIINILKQLDFSLLTLVLVVMDENNRNFFLRINSTFKMFYRHVLLNQREQL